MLVLLQSHDTRYPGVYFGHPHRSFFPPVFAITLKKFREMSGGVRSYCQDPLSGIFGRKWVAPRRRLEVRWNDGYSNPCGEGWL